MGVHSKPACDSRGNPEGFGRYPQGSAPRIGYRFSTNLCLPQGNACPKPSHSFGALVLLFIFIFEVGEGIFLVMLFKRIRRKENLGRNNGS